EEPDTGVIHYVPTPRHPAAPSAPTTPAKKSFKQQCLFCDSWIPIDDAGMIGRKINCPRCQNPLVIKDPDTVRKPASKPSNSTISKPSSAPARPPAEDSKPDGKLRQRCPSCDVKLVIKNRKMIGRQIVCP